MNLLEALQRIDSMKALELLGLTADSQGSYIKFPCECGATASLKAYGDKKNMWYCPTCKKGNHIVALAMQKKNLDYMHTRQELLNKCGQTGFKYPEPLQLVYELTYHKYIEEQQITAETCKTLGIGVPKGKAMLSGCVAFSVMYDGKRIAYYGLRLKNLQPVFHRSFNPEHHLYNFTTEAQHFTTDLYECVRMIQDGKNTVCNFGLPYLSQRHIELLNKLKFLQFHTKESEIINQAKNLQCFHKF